MLINGKEFNVKYNVYAAEQYSQVKGLGKSVTANVMAILWMGYLGWCYVKQVDPEITFEEVSDFVDTADENEDVKQLIVDCNKKYLESELYRKLIKKMPAIEEKKSVEVNGNTDGLTYTNSLGEKSGSSPESITS